MSKRYVIRWKSKVNGRAGKGTKVFDLEQAELLARELNTEYPDIEHEPVLWTEPPPMASEAGPPPASPEPAEQAPEVEAEEPDNVHVLSFNR